MIQIDTDFPWKNTDTPQGQALPKAKHNNGNHVWCQGSVSDSDNVNVSLPAPTEEQL